MLVTRREILQRGLALPFVLAPEPRMQILTEGHCLSGESAAGFRKLVCWTPRNVIIAAAWRDLNSESARELKRQVIAGALLLFESAPDYSVQQAQQLAAQFQIQVAPPIDLNGAHEWTGQYVEYCGPIQRWVRPFLAAVPLDGSQAKTLARVNGLTVAVERRLGRGKIIFLGSLLGPNLFAEEREAHEVALALLS